MDQRDLNYGEMRDTWHDYRDRQEFEHELINRKTTWLLTGETILFAAYGFSFGVASGDAFRRVVASAGLSVAAITLLGIAFIIRSKRISWHDYKDFYAQRETPNPPSPLTNPLQWGVRDGNTWWTLLPDLLLPVVFIAAWGYLLVLK
jgi:hypothetical protein